MKLCGIVLIALLLAGSAPAGTPRTEFIGEISDSQCALNVHSLSRSHNEMIKRRTLGTDAASCSKACIRRGGEWVLRLGENVYRLVDQTGIEAFAGQQVKVTGTLNAKTKTIDNHHIEALAPQH